MLIRPYTLSQMSMLLLAGFLLVYLQIAMRRSPGVKGSHTRWMILAIAWVWLVLLISLIIGISEDPRIDFLAYTRIGVGMLAWHAIAKAIYALPPFEPFDHRQEARFTSWAIAGFLCLEIGYFALRLWRFSQTGLAQAFVWPMALPTVFVSQWVLLLITRKLWMAEAAPGLSLGQRLRRVVLAPQSDVGRFYRGFLLATFGMSLSVLLFNFMAVVIVVLPIWMLIAADLLVTTAILVALFAYLVSPYAPTGLQIRVMGAGLTIFLWLISVLGWIVTLTFLKYQAPGIDPIQIFGTQMQTHFVTSAPYRPLAELLSDLLAPLLWFALGGSLFYMLLYTTYYRRTLQSSLAQIIDSFRQVQQGNLAYRIPPSTWQDEFSQIGVSFNQMTDSLDQANQELTAYQQGLEELVERRTAQLGQEMELRKNLELRQGIQDERERIAQETHDGMLQTLMGVRIRLTRGKRISQLEAQAIQAEMAEMADEITQSIQDLRNLINELNEQILPEGLAIGLERLIQRYERTYPVSIHLDLAYTPGLLPLNQELNVLRIVQEALSNASRHSGATQVLVTLGCDYADGRAVALIVQIRDNGRGFDLAERLGRGSGLRNMQRRAAQLGAVLDIRSQSGAETAIRLTVPAPLAVSDLATAYPVTF